VKDEKEFLELRAEMLKRAIQSTAKDIAHQAYEAVSIRGAVEDHPFASIGVSFAGGFFAAAWMQTRPSDPKPIPIQTGDKSSALWPLLLSPVVDVGKAWLQHQIQEFFFSPQEPRADAEFPSAPSDSPNNPVESPLD